jgi:SOS-response transcriptional repressor LexA
MVRKRKLGEEIAFLRRRKELTQVELAEKAGTTQVAISSYEKGKMNPSPKILRKLSEVLDTDFDHLLELLEEEKIAEADKKEADKAEGKTIASKSEGGRLVKVGEISDVVTVPVLGHVHAGDPNFIPDREIIDLIKLPRRIGRSADYALVVAGMSMVEAGIIEGDTVLVKNQPDADNNQIVIARVNNEEYTIKRLKKNEKGEAWLEPANPHYKAIKGKPFEVIGKIVYLIKKFT